MDDVSFRVSAGESVALLGPNGAGKSTMMRMLSGVLRPSGGTISCLGETPARRSRGFLMRTSLIMGQKQRANLDVPLRASLELQRVLYDISRGEFDETLARFEDLLGLGPYIDRPVRTLSLGERMRGELAMGLLHHPELVLLDEPTIGLDAASQRSLRGFLREYNRATGATIILTSHYMEDVEAVCDRAPRRRKARLRRDTAGHGLPRSPSPAGGSHPRPGECRRGEEGDCGFRAQGGSGARRLGVPVRHERVLA